MKMRSLFLVFIVFAAVTAGLGQSRTLTNADLEKYRVDREKAEREYRENYAKLGFPSPEELARRRQKSDLENQEFVTRLRQERLEAERQQAETRRAAVYYNYIPAQSQRQVGDYAYFWSYGRSYRYPIQRTYTQPGYFAGGQFWPTGPRTPPRPQPLPPRISPRH